MTTVERTDVHRGFMGIGAASVQAVANLRGLYEQLKREVMGAFRHLEQFDKRARHLKHCPPPLAIDGREYHRRRKARGRRG